MSNLNKSHGKFLKLVLVLLLALVLSSVAFVQVGAQDIRPDRPVPDLLDRLKLDSTITVDAAALKVAPALLDASGQRQVVVRLSEAPVARTAAESNMSRPAQSSQRSRILSQQEAVLQQVRTLDADARVLGTTQIALNALMLEVDAAVLAELAANPDVVSINPVINYEMDLDETVPYIGATEVQAMGFDGSGVSVAVLDSGVDYTHAHLGGSGDPADYQNNDPTMIDPGTFPTAKVVGGFDFVGDDWDGSSTTPPLAPDPDPLDSGLAPGHGTHVADIIAGGGGVAPGADLYALKVCSSVSTSCSGVALLQAMDFVLDPDGDGDASDHVDVVNMSLGALYGQVFDDDLSLAVDNASQAGVLTVAASGNASDKPYVTDTPAAAPSALSVAQTNVPSAILPLMEILEPASIAGFYQAVWQPWSAPLTEVIEAPVQYGDGNGGNLLGCEPFAPGSLVGVIVLVDRGECNFTLKISNISQAGGEAGIIGLVAPGDPFVGGDGGDRPIDIPGFMISQADADAIKSGLDEGVIARFDPSIGIPLIGHVVGSSSRGPSMLTNNIKPEIGAPGASVSAIAGSGTGVEPFSGTSGATPMVSGSAALVMDAFPGRSWLEVKAVLMNTAETDIINKAELDGGDLAPISRIGGGEVRVNRAVASPAAAWDSDAPTGALSFGFHDVYRGRAILKRQVIVRNFTDQGLHYDIRHTFRYENDADNGAVTLNMPGRVFVPANGDASFWVIMHIDGRQLREWSLNSGSLGADPAPLTELEYDGYIWLDNMATGDDDEDPLHLPWHVLPRQAGNVRVGDETVAIDGSFQGIPAGDTSVRNRGVGDAPVESYSLLATSDDLPEGGPGEQNPTPDFRYFGYATFPVPADFCSENESFVMAFAINTWERQTHANAPASFWINLDVDQDPTTGGGPSGAEYTVISRDFTLNTLGDGRNLAWVIDWSTGNASAFFFTDHDTNSGNTVLLICGEQIGMDADDFFHPIDVTAQATDFYFGGDGDLLTGITISPLGEQYLGVFEEGGIGSTVIEPRTSETLHVLDFGQSTNNTESGLLLLFRKGAPEDNEAAAIMVEE